MASNQAAWVDSQGKRLRVGDAPMPKAGPDRVVIRNEAIAINPSDWKVQDSGILIKKWPAVLGTDVAGEAVEVGEDIKNFKKGDRVAAHVISLLTNDPSDGGFALYSSAQAGCTTLLPSSVSFVQGCVIPLAIDTASVGLFKPFSDGFLGLPLPSLDPTPSGKTIVIWGGSSSVGSMAIQLAAATGTKIITTASEHNFDFCKSLGASEVFDYQNPNVVDNVVKAVQASSGSFIGALDSVSEMQSFQFTLPIMEKLGGNLAVVLDAPKQLSANVKIGRIVGIDKFTHPIWADFVPKALEGGRLKCLPEPLVIGKGLESIQKGLDENKKGVSARKVVVEL